MNGLLVVMVYVSFNCSQRKPPTSPTVHGCAESRAYSALASAPIRRFFSSTVALPAYTGASEISVIDSRLSVTSK